MEFSCLFQEGLTTGVILCRSTSGAPGGGDGGVVGQVAQRERREKEKENQLRFKEANHRGNLPTEGCQQLRHHHWASGRPAQTGGTWAPLLEWAE